MSHEEPRFAAHFRAPVAEETRDAMWKNIRASRTQSGAPRRRVLLTTAGLAAAAALVLGLRARHTAQEVALSAPGPLHLEQGGEPVPAVLRAAANSATSSTGFDDHSRIVRTQGTGIEVLENTATIFALKQADGEAHYEVTPGGPRRWSVETPLARIEVVGTEFEVRADATHTHVAVSHGVVLVRGERVPEHVQRLTAGQSLDVAKPADVVQTMHVVQSAPSTLPSAVASDYNPTSQAKLLPVRDSKVDTLWSDADRARSQHDTSAAMAALSAIVKEHPNDERAGLAALTMGRMRVDVISEPARAAEDFATALRLGVSPALREDAQLRRCEALVASGQEERAATEARAWVGEHSESAARFARWTK